MFRIESMVDTRSPDYRRNFEEMSRVVAEYKARLASVREGGPAKSRELHKSRGKLLVRERLDRLFDPRTNSKHRLSGLTRIIPKKGMCRPGFPAAGK